MKNTVKPCTSYDQKGKQLAGVRYHSNQYEDWDFPCFSYDPLNKSSRKAAIKAATQSGEDMIAEAEAEVREEMRKEKIKKQVGEQT